MERVRSSFKERTRNKVFVGAMGLFLVSHPSFHSKVEAQGGYNAIMDSLRGEYETGMTNLQNGKPLLYREPPPEPPAPPTPEIEKQETDFDSLIPWFPPKLKKYDPLFVEFGERYAIDADFLRIIATIENRHDDVDHRAGLMQVMEDTAPDVIRKMSPEDKKEFFAYRPLLNLKDPRTSVWLAGAYINQHMRQLGVSEINEETVPLLAAGYVGGIGGADKYRDKDIFVFDQRVIPCYAETARWLWEIKSNDDFTFEEVDREIVSIFRRCPQYASLEQ